MNIEAASPESRIKWYIEFMVALHEESLVTKDLKRDILSEYLYTPEGRLQIAQSLVQPAKLRYGYYKKILDTKSEKFDWSWNRLINGVKGLTIEYENFFSILPEGERFSDPVCVLREVVGKFFTLYCDALEASAGLDRDAVIFGTVVPRDSAGQIINQDT